MCLSNSSLQALCIEVMDHPNFHYLLDLYCIHHSNLLWSEKVQYPSMNTSIQCDIWCLTRSSIIKTWLHCVLLVQAKLKHIYNKLKRWCDDYYPWFEDITKATMEINVEFITLSLYIHTQLIIIIHHFFFFHKSIHIKFWSYLTANKTHQKQYSTRIITFIFH